MNGGMKDIVVWTVVTGVSLPAVACEYERRLQTSGEPGDGSSVDEESVRAHVRTLPIYTYQRMFGMYQAGLGAALANVMFFLLLVAVVIYFRTFHRDEEV